MKIYVVTTGDYYSGYCVLAATFDKERAEALRERYLINTYEDVEITEIEEGVPETFFQNCWNISFDRKGGVSGITKSVPNLEREPPIEKILLDQISGFLHATVVAESIEEAIKIGMQRAKEYLKEQEVCENG